MPSNLAQLRHAFFHLSEGRVNAGKDVLASVIQDIETEGCEDDKFTREEAVRASTNIWLTIANRWMEIAFSSNDVEQSKVATEFSVYAYHMAVDQSA